MFSKFVFLFLLLTGNYYAYVDTTNGNSQSTFSFSTNNGRDVTNVCFSFWYNFKGVDIGNFYVEDNNGNKLFYRSKR